MAVLTNFKFTSKTNLTTRRHVGRNSAVSLIGIHTMEAPEGLQTAENVANYFKRVNASSHWCVDADSRVRVVEDKDTAWTLPGANSRSLNIEIAGYAKQTKAEWADAYSIKALEIAARCAAEWCKKYNIPVRRLSHDQIRSGAKGFVGHDDISKVYKQSTHWDPGPNFPWDYFFTRVRAQMDLLDGKIKETAITTPGYNNHGYSMAYITERQKQLIKLGYKIDADGYWGPKSKTAMLDFQKGFKLEEDGIPGPKSAAAMHTEIEKRKAKKTTKPVKVATKKLDVRPLQKAVGAFPDNIWGPDTQKRLDTVRAASRLGGGRFPHGLTYAQGVVRTKTDGIWGSNSRKAHDKAVIRIEKAVLIMGHNPGKIDGIWTTQLDKALANAKKRANTP